MNKKYPSRRDFLKISLQQSAVALSIPLFYRSSNARPKKSSPNFIFILSDDQGWNGTSVQMQSDRLDSKSDYHITPNLRRLASQGMRLSNGYSPAALCCPTRRSIQFGQTPVRQGEVHFKEKYPRDNQKLTIPRLLKSIDPNYRAAHFGKWDLRTDLVPEDLGYDESDGNTRNSQGNAASDFGKSGKWHNILETEDPKLIFSLTDRANDFMERQVEAYQPFYLQISHYAVHVDMHTRPETLKKYKNKEKGKLHKIPAFAGMTEDLDTGLGKVLDKIEELGISDNTYVFYMADNGAVPWIPPDRRKHLSNPTKLGEDRSRNYPLRAGKWTLYEGGIRVPFIVKGPRIMAGSNSEVPVIGWDLLPTIVDLAGYKNSMPNDVDGGSFKNLLENAGNGTVKRPSDFFVFHRYAKAYPHSAIRDGDYKFVKFWKTGETYLFNLKDNLGETENLVKKMPDKARELERKLMEYLKAVDAEILNSYGN